MTIVVGPLMVLAASIRVHPSIQSNQTIGKQPSIRFAPCSKTNGQALMWSFVLDIKRVVFFVWCHMLSKAPPTSFPLSKASYKNIISIFHGVYYVNLDRSLFDMLGGYYLFKMCLICQLNLS